MKWLESFTLIMRSNITTLREKLEDPERVLNQLLVDMEEELERVRASVAEAIVDEIQLGKQADEARKEASTWQARAESALQRGDEASSRAALEQKLASEQRAADLQEGYEKQKAETARLQRGVSDLEDKVRKARQRRTLLLARLAKADSSRAIQRAFDRVDSRSAFTQFGRLEERVERAEALGIAQDRLAGKDPDAEELAREFEEKERKEKVESELEELKKRMGGT